MDVKKTIGAYKKRLKATGYSEYTIAGYSRNLDYFERYLKANGLNDLRQVNRIVIHNYQAQVMGEPVEKSTKALKIRVVKHMFAYLVDTHRLLINPAEGLDLVPRKPNRIAPVLTVKDVKTLLGIPDLTSPIHYRNRTIMEVLYATGIRHGELLNLRMDHVDLTETILFVKQGKGRKDRMVPLGQTAAGYLRRYMKEIRPTFAPKTSPMLFVTRFGRPFKGVSVYAFLRIYRHQAGIQTPVSPHTFRRSFATHLMQQGADIRYVQKMLGHKKLSTTQAYTKVLPVDVKQIHEQTHPGQHFTIEDAHDD